MSQALIIGHHDALFRLELEGGFESFLEGSDTGHIDLPRAQEAGVVASFFACWVPQPVSLMDDDEQDEEDDTDDDEVQLDSPIDPEYARDHVDPMIERLHGLVDASDGELVLIRDVDDLDACRESGQQGAILHFEGAEPLAGALGLLEHYYAQGLRSLGVVWARSNEFATGVPFRFNSTPDTGPGLTESGRDLVEACNELGILLDLSHLNEQGFWDIAKLSRHPLVASHSNAHALCPSARNLTDEQLLAVRDSNGIVGINFCTSDLRSDGREDDDTDVDLVIEQVLYMVETMGIDHVGFGTDFDGAVVPSALSDVTSMVGVLALLEERGFDGESLEKLAYGNWRRVLGDTWS